VHEYRRAGRLALQAGDLSAPAEVAAVVAAVFGLHGTPLERQPAVREPLDVQATPELLMKLYNVSGVQISRGGKNKRATAEFQNQYTSGKDLAAFLKRYVPAAQEGDEQYACVPGHCEPVGREKISVEAMLDVEYIMGTSPGIKTEVWTFSSMAWCTDLKNWTSHVLDHDDPPLVFSVSYGVQGNVSLDKTQGCSEAISHNIEEDFAKISARGITLIFSSGDQGSGGTVFVKTKLWPVWPGSAPHATAVGATQFAAGQFSEEVATRKFGSGGGFSWYWPGQPWQRDAVDSYLKNPKATLPDPRDFPQGGRATPDVAALGQGYAVIVNGNTIPVGGTSAAAPLFAGIVSLLNEYRLQNGKSPLGFLNPLLYEMGKAGKGFKDVTKGNNWILAGSPIPTREGYACTEGWDAVTGWGTPIFDQLLDYVKGLPSGRGGAEVIV